MYYWTADTHFSHGNILKYSNRIIFMNKYEKEIMKNGTEEDIKELRISEETLEKHNNALIRNWNQRVKETDTVFFLGDFCFRNSKGGKEGEGTQTRAEYYINKLNGRIVFISGNHDKNNSLKTIMTEAIIEIANKKIRMLHNPYFVNANYKIHFAGHVHKNWKFKRVYFDENTFTDVVNVGVDVWNYFPITIDEILKEYNRWKKNLNE